MENLLNILAMIIQPFVKCLAREIEEKVSEGKEEIPAGVEPFDPNVKNTCNYFQSMESFLEEEENQTEEKLKEKKEKKKKLM